MITDIKFFVMITLKTLPQATSLEVFEQCAAHLREQNIRCLDDIDNSCKYRSGNLKCAAGCFIGDDEYHKSMELVSWSNLKIKGIVPREHYNLIQDLQQIHDLKEPYEWDRALTELEKQVRAGDYEGSLITFLVLRDGDI